MSASKRKAARSAPEADTQKETLYDWEDLWFAWNRNTNTFASCKRVIRYACRLYRVKAPKIVAHRNSSMSFCQGDTISLQATGMFGRRTHGGKNIPVCLHEAAHYITDKIFDRTHAHGPTFLGIYMWLLNQWKIAPPGVLESSARRMGLRWRSGLSPVKCKR